MGGLPRHLPLDLDTFDSGRNFAAWLGLVPRQRSTGGKARLGSVSKMGQTDIRRLLIVGAMSVIRWVVRKGSSANRWLAALVARKPKMVAAVALTNKMARMIWALSTKQENYRMAWPDPEKEKGTTWPQGQGERSTRSTRYGLRCSRQGHSDPGLKRLQLSEPM